AVLGQRRERERAGREQRGRDKLSSIGFHYDLSISNCYRNHGSKDIIAAPIIARRFSFNLEVYRHAEETFSFNWCLRYGDGVIGGGGLKSKAPGHRGCQRLQSRRR